MSSALQESLSEESPSFSYADPFTPSRTRKKRKNRISREPVSPHLLLVRTRRDLSTNDWLHKSTQHLRDTLAFLPSQPLGILCLGLGSPSGSPDARAQLVFLLAVCDDLSIVCISVLVPRDITRSTRARASQDRAKVAVYDPVFTEQDIELLDTLAVSRIAENKHARHRVESPTIVFMPHCDLQLYENLLRENWSRDRLSHLILIANRLSDYADSAPSRRFSVEHPCVSRLTPYLTSRLLPACTAYPTAFNNTAIQVARLDSAPGEWWEEPQRPTGADA
ncbi:hypothetical protein B0H21DRAFT_280471 [Amylocystis lapponica]|nr:hypothetical protein B0H21DRAFT_280471 [Amylocystis lapponica]